MGSNRLKTLIVALYNYNGQGLDAWHDHGAGMTYTVAKLSGHDVHFLDMKSLSNDQQLDESLKGYDLVAFGLKSSYYSKGMNVIEFAKKHGAKVLVGGYHATAAPEQLLENPNIDWVMHGESEITFPKFLDDPSSFPREFFGEKPQDLSSLPFMDRSMYREPVENCLNWWHGGKLKNMISVMAARGCPYKCAFCQPIESNHFGKKLRRRSVDSMIAELLHLKKLYKPDCVMIHDDTFLIQPKWIEEFIDKYPQVGLPFWASGRADGICQYPDLVKKLVKVGWGLISVGFESGSQRILDKLNKGTTVEQNLEAARIIKSCGAKIYANYITGIPWETKWDIQATHRMADTIDAEMPSWAFFTPYPGCDLGTECIERDWSLLNRENYDRCPSGIKVKHVDYDYINKVRQGFREEVYPTFCDIIIPSYKNEHFTIQCIESIKKCTSPGKYRIIWVDNASESSPAVDESLRLIDHITIKLPTNEGFVGAINAGLAVSDAPNVCLLNNDTIVSPGWLDKLISAMAKDSKLGIAGALTHYGKGLAVDSHHSLSLHSQLLPEDAPTWDLDKINKHLESGYSGRTYPIEFVAFLCAVIKREVLDKVGPLDPNYAMGMWDDLDYNRGAQAAGYKTELVLDTCIKHFGRSTFNLIQMKEKFDVDSLLKSNRAYLDKKWGGISEAFDTIIITRAVYDTFGDTPGLGILTNKRLELMQRYFINSLKNQTDKLFTIYVVVGSVENETTKKIKALDWGTLNPSYIHIEGNLNLWRESVKTSKKYDPEIDPGCPEYLAKKCDHPKTSIMARMDIDDWVAPGWIAHMKYMAKNINKNQFVLNYQVIGQHTDGRLYTFSNKHTKARTSPFLVLVQKTEPRISPYQFPHIQMGSKFSYVYDIPPAYVYMVLHDENRSNHIYPNDIFIGDCKDIKSEIPTKKLTIQHISHSTQKDDWRSRIARANVQH